MTTKHMSVRNRIVSAAGYTLDQTILIVAIIAILITMIIATVGWDLINRSGGAKLAAQLRQMEDATGQFFAEHQVWPHLSYDGGSGAPTNNGTMNLRILANAANKPTLLGSMNASDMKNLIPGLEYDNTNFRHSFGQGGAVYAAVLTPDASVRLSPNQYMLIEFRGVPIAEALEADENIDGRSSTTAIAGTTGRVIFRTTTNCVNTAANTATATVSGVNPGASTVVNLCYFANVIQ